MALLEIMKTALDEHENEVQAQVETKKVAARNRYMERLNQMGADAEQAARIHRRKQIQLAPTGRESIVDCPVCESPARISGNLLSDLFDSEWGPYEDNFRLEPTRLYCSICELLLEGEELGIVGLDGPIEPDYEPPEEAIEQLREWEASEE